jgi:hypothetical protein
MRSMLVTFSSIMPKSIVLLQQVFHVILCNPLLKEQWRSVQPLQRDRNSILRLHELKQVTTPIKEHVEVDKLQHPAIRFQSPERAKQSITHNLNKAMQ